MITCSPLTQDIKKFSAIDEDVLEDITKSVINQPRIINSATIISPSSSFYDRWIKNTKSFGLTYFRSLSCHDFLRSPHLLNNHLFVTCGDLPECSTESLQQLITNRISAPFHLSKAKPTFGDSDIEQFNSARIDLDLVMRINKITNAFFNDEISDLKYGFMSSNRLHAFGHHTRSLEVRKDLIDYLKERLSDSPEDFLESAIQEIKTPKRGS